MDADKKKKKKKAPPTPDVNVSAIESAEIPDVTLPQCAADRSATWTAVIWNNRLHTLRRSRIQFAGACILPFAPGNCERQAEAEVQLHVQYMYISLIVAGERRDRARLWRTTPGFWLAPGRVRKAWLGWPYSLVRRWPNLTPQP